MPPIVLELLLVLVVLWLAGLVLTQSVIPNLMGKKTWWLFRKKSSAKSLNEAKVNLEEAKGFQELKSVEKEIEDINNPPPVAIPATVKKRKPVKKTNIDIK